MPDPIIRMEFRFHPDTCTSDLTRLSTALDALEAMGVIKSTVQLGQSPEEASRWPKPLADDPIGPADCL